MVFTHIPVLLTECLQGLQLKPDGIYLDGTFGRGGHSRAILQKLGPHGRLYALDRDAAAIEAAQELADADPRFHISRANFAELSTQAQQWGIAGKVDGILLDIGISSPQIDDPERGFSFEHDGPLDMRMDQRTALSAQDMVNTYPEDKLAYIFKTYGEERFAKRAARAITLARAKAPLTRTKELAALLAAAIPGAPGHKHKATRCFQALRIAVNGELDALPAALNGALQVLAPGGRLCVISFHSLEDRIVKNFFQENSQLPAFTRTLPLTEDELQARYGDKLTLKLIGKPLKAGEAELARNIRARSATLRSAERVGVAAEAAARRGF